MTATRETNASTALPSLSGMVTLEETQRLREGARMYAEHMKKARSDLH